jgi:hypothetical protein
MAEFQLHRLGMVMEPEAGNPSEVEGVLKRQWRTRRSSNGTFNLTGR